MSAIIIEKIYIDVTRGDCVESNRKNGKSNTGTYFLCSICDFNKFESYFNDQCKYVFDLEQIQIYKTLFNIYCKRYSNEYNGKMENFESNCDYLLAQDDTNVKIDLRINDSRVFMRFQDNNLPKVKAFRHILYEDLTKISFEKKGEYIVIYPIVSNIEIINNGVTNNLVFDDID